MILKINRKLETKLNKSKSLDGINTINKNAFIINLYYTIFRCLQKKEKKLKHYYESKLFIIEKLSVENILKSLINLDVFKRMILNDNQYMFFKLIPKQNSKSLKLLEENNIQDLNMLKFSNISNLDKDDVCKRILEFY